MSRVPQPLSAFLGSAVVSLVLLSAREAHAGSRAGALWYVETVGPNCRELRGALEREISLACNAVGGTCNVAPLPRDAELRAVLDCSGSEESWTLVTRTIDGTVLATLDLSGPRADRLREAAVEVARDVAPERSLAIETLRYAIPNETPTRARRSPERLTLVAGGRASSLTGGEAPSLFGLHVLAGLAVAKSARITLGASGEAGGAGAAAMRHFRYGAGFALGAPFEWTSVFGVAVEGGVAATSAYGPPSSDGGNLATRHVSTGYAQGTLTLQIPRGSVRPFFALSAAALTDGTQIVASGEAGLAFALF